MLEIMTRLGGFRAAISYKRKLEEIQEKASVNPDNLLFQVRIGDFLAKLKKKTEAIAVYEQTAQKFIQKNLFAHAIALKKIIFRLEPMYDTEEQQLVLGRLYDQMLKYRERTSDAAGKSSQKSPLGSPN